MIQHIIAVILVGSLAFPTQAENISTQVGVWKPVGLSDIDIFNGDITITSVKKKTPGFYTVIYDKDKHALVCFYVPEDDYAVCIPALLNKNKITPDDQIEDILEGTLMSGSMFVRTKEKDSKLTISIAPFGSDCTNPAKCVFKELPVYQRK